MRFLLRNSINNYYCIDFTSEMCAYSWTKTQKLAKHIALNPRLVASWPVRLLSDIEKINLLSADYTIIEIDSMPLDKFKNLYPEFFI